MFPADVGDASPDLSGVPRLAPPAYPFPVTICLLHVICTRAEPCGLGVRLGCGGIPVLG
jgi:hypothetical protein